MWLQYWHMYHISPITKSFKLKSEFPRSHGIIFSSNVQFLQVPCSSKRCTILKRITKVYILLQWPTHAAASCNLLSINYNLPPYPKRLNTIHLIFVIYFFWREDHCNFNVSSRKEYKRKIIHPMSKMILQEIRQCNLSTVVRIKPVKLIADLWYIFLSNLSHLFKLEDNIFWFAENKFSIKKQWT